LFLSYSQLVLVNLAFSTPFQRNGFRIAMDDLRSYALCHYAVRYTLSTRTCTVYLSDWFNLMIKDRRLLNKVIKYYLTQLYFLFTHLQRNVSALRS